MGAGDMEEELYRVVVNDEEQYSIWPLEKENAAGWRDGGRSGTPGSVDRAGANEAGR